MSESHDQGGPQEHPPSSDPASQPESLSSTREAEEIYPYAPPRAEMLLAEAVVPTRTIEPPTPPRFARLARWSWILSCLSVVPIVILIVMAVLGDPFKPVMWPALIAEVVVTIGSVLALLAYCGNSASGSNGARVEAIVGAAISIVALLFVNLGAFGAIGVTAMRQDWLRGRPATKPAVIRPLENTFEWARP